MKLNRIHAIIGLLLVLVPFTGFTREFKYGFSVVAGAVILYFAINSIHIELRKKHRKPHRHDTFVESKPLHKEDTHSMNETENIEINKVDSSEIIQNIDTPSDVSDRNL